MMDKSKLLYLITLETMGRISAEDSSKLFEAMQSDKDFPWKEMGEYQNLAALLSMVVNSESPAKDVKDRMINGIEQIGKRNADLDIKPHSETTVVRELTVEKNEPIEEDNFHDDEPDEAKTKKEELKIIDHSNEFEEVKAKLFKIKDHQIKTSETGTELIEEEVDEIPFVKRPKQKKSANKSFKTKYFIAAGIAFIVAVCSAVLYLNFFNNNIEEQKKIATKETETLISKSRVTAEEKEPVVMLETISQVEQQNNEQIQFKSGEEETKNPEIPIEMIEGEKEENTQKPDLPPLQNPDFIDAPLVIEEEKENSDKIVDPLTTTNLEKELPPKEEILINEEPVYFVAVEEMPQPIGGISSIQKRIIYPEIAKRAGIEGKVLVLAFVDESGNVTRTEVIKGIGLGCDEAAIDAILKTKFQPGKQRGKPVKVKVTIPVTFKL